MIRPLFEASLRALRVILLMVVAFSSAGFGCGDIGGFGRQAESQTPERLRGLSLSYDLTKIGEEKPPVLPSPVEPRVQPPSAKPIPVTVWWQTPDGVVHQEEVDTRVTPVDRTRYVGSVWLEVTPVGSKPDRLSQTNN